jgi:hypothetical protein
MQVSVRVKFVNVFSWTEFSNYDAASILVKTRWPRLLQCLSSLIKWVWGPCFVRKISCVTFRCYFTAPCGRSSEWTTLICLRFASPCIVQFKQITNQIQQFSSLLSWRLFTAQHVSSVLPPETCWAVNKRQDNKLENCYTWLVIYLNCTLIRSATWQKLSRYLLGKIMVLCNLVGGYSTIISEEPDASFFRGLGGSRLPWYFRVTPLNLRRAIIVSESCRLPLPVCSFILLT